MERFYYPRCQKVLPAIYDESLSYYETLCKLVHKINELIENINSIDIDKITEDVLNQVRDELQTEINKIYQEIEENNEEINNKFDGVYQTMSENYVELDNKINKTRQDLEKEINKLNQLIISLNEAVYIYIDSEIERVYKFIKEYQCKTVMCYNPVNGFRQPICDVFGSMYDALRYLGITANEFDELGLTCNSFESNNLSATKFDLYAKYYFKKIKDLYMINPFNGEYVYYQEVITTLADFHRGAPLTATEYDALLLTATVYDEKEITAYNYDFNGKNLLSA